jgi:hypothetical protein
MTKDEALKLALEALENNRRRHHYCEDVWYSCPKHEEGCANEGEGDKCNCGADEANQEIDTAITAIKQALAAPVQEPLASIRSVVANDALAISFQGLGQYRSALLAMIDATPAAQRKPLDDWQIDLIREEKGVEIDFQEARHFARAIEAAHNIKENT